MAVDDDCKIKFLDLKSKRCYRYIIYKIDPKAQKVVIEKLGGPAEAYDAFTGSLPENDCRYAIYDYEFVTSDNCQKSKIFFFAWCIQKPSHLLLNASLLKNSIICGFTCKFRSREYGV